jgi:hypothetical protein
VKNLSCIEAVGMYNHSHAQQTVFISHKILPFFLAKIALFAQITLSSSQIVSYMTLFASIALFAQTHIILLVKSRYLRG